MAIGRCAIQLLIVKPLLVAWAVLITLIMAFVIWEAYIPLGMPLVNRLFVHRINVGSPEWKAVAVVDSLVPAHSTVLVETDNDYFFYLLRYHTYPRLVCTANDSASSDIGAQDSLAYLISYQDGILEVGLTEW
jgi:hypothetical protein